MPVICSPAQALHDAHSMALRLHRDGAGLAGYGIAHLFDGDGVSLRVEPFANIITDAGDLYYASAAITGVAPSLNVAPTLVTGMQVGTDATLASKNGVGSAMVAFLAGQAFDPTYPTLVDLGLGAGVQAVYKTTYAPGVGTGIVQEATITNGALGTTSAEAETISRVTFTSITKGVADSLAVSWMHLFHG